MPEALTFADQPHTGLLVALWLDTEASSALAVLRGESADALHITLCYCGDTEELGELAVARAITAVERETRWRAPLTGKVGGYGRFLASDSSDGKDVFYAAVDVPGLAEVRQSVATALMEAGCLPSQTHGYTPHITLAYLKPDADNPIDRIAPLDLTFAAVTIMAGTRRIDIPLSAPVAMFAVRDAGDAPKLHVYQPVEFAEPPEWVQFLPTPGSYDHPLHGVLDFSPAAYAETIANFKSGLYQEKLPVTVEHERFSSAVGWITDMRLSETGGVEAKVDWNKRGKTLIDDDRYLYVSAEWFKQWSPPDDPTTFYDNVAVGLTLCTRPYFKERVLPPLAASEAVLTRHAGVSGEEVLMGETKPQEQQTPPAAEQPADESTTTTPTDVQQATDQIIAQLSEKMGDKAKISDPIVAEFVERAAREVATSRIEAKKNEDRAALLATENATLQAQNRVKFFSDEVLGRSDQNGTPWVGDVSDHVRMACSLTEKYGKDSWELTHYIQSNRAHAEQAKAGSLFKEIGTGRGGAEGLMAYDKLASLAAERARASGGKETFEQAFDAVLMSEHDLRAAYARERRRDS